LSDFSVNTSYSCINNSCIRLLTINRGFLFIGYRGVSISLSCKGVMPELLSLLRMMCVVRLDGFNSGFNSNECSDRLVILL
jgi:hypothetical protein